MKALLVGSNQTQVVECEWVGNTLRVVESLQVDPIAVFIGNRRWSVQRYTTGVVTVLYLGSAQVCVSDTATIEKLFPRSSIRGQ